MAELGDIPATLVFYESPKRVAAMLQDAAEVLGETREAAVCRELTKKFEECVNGTLASLAAEFAERSVRGEIVVLISRRAEGETDAFDTEAELRKALESMSVRDASDVVSKASGQPKRKVYQLALALDKERKG